MVKTLLHALRSSEFWTVVAQATIQAVGMPVPDEFKQLGWAYVALRVLSKAAKFVFPHPEGGSWLKPD